MEVSLFVRRSANVVAARLDPRIRPSSHMPFGCGEETDFLLQLMGKGIRGRFERRTEVIHSRREMATSEVSQDHAISYGRGVGGVLRKHSFDALWAGLVAYDLARCGLVAARGKRTAAQLCPARAKGLVSGYSSMPANSSIAEAF